MKYSALLLFLSLSLVICWPCDNSCDNLGANCNIWNQTCTCYGNTIAVSSNKKCQCVAPLSCDSSGNNQACTPATSYYLSPPSNWGGGSNQNACTACTAPLVCAASTVTGCNPATGYYINIVSNVVSCVTCTTPNVCTGSNVTSCNTPTTFFINTSNRPYVCQACTAPLVCAGSAITGCTPGSAYWFKTSTNPYQCVACGTNCGTCTQSACTACTSPTGFYLNGQNCTTCSSPNVCTGSNVTSCNTPTTYFLNNSSSPTVCSACSAPLICASNAITGCTGAYYYNTSTNPKSCVACGTNCATCPSSASTCTNCTTPASMYINGVNCVNCSAPLVCASNAITGCTGAYYFNTSTNPYSCVACGTNCSTCTSTACTACTSTTTFYLSGTTCTSCAAPLVCTSSAITGCTGAYYFNSTTNPKSCVACGSNCATCTSTACTACTNPTGQYIGSSGTTCSTCSSPLICASSAITGCSGSNYLNTSTNPKTCVGCNSNCTTCTASACSVCSSLTSYYISGANCVGCGSPLVCTANVITGCTSGQAYFYNTSTNPYSCVACGSNCSTCNLSACTACTNPTTQFINGTSCTACSTPLVCASSLITGCTPTTNYYLSNSTTPKSCVPCNSPMTCAASAITGCTGAYYLNGTSCTACAANCTSCTSTTCSSCSGSYYPSGSTCVACPVQCSACTSTTCSSCVSPCASCTFAACTGCVATNQYITSPATTCNTCPSHCLTCNVSTCLTCVSPCATCSRTACLTCISALYYVSSTTCLACGSPCSGCNSGGCTSCPLTNQYVTGANCSTCPTQCLTCTSSACQSCVSPCSTCSRTACLTCIAANYYVSGTTCIQCDSTCATCNASGCLTCPNTNQYVSGVGCLTCPLPCLTCTLSGCQSCQSPCATCTLTGCASCINDTYYLNANVTSCVLQSGCTIISASGSGCSTCTILKEYSVGSTCLACPTHCASCTSTTCPTCVAPCYTCSYTSCLSCMTTNMYPIGATCASCDASCAVCGVGGCQSCPLTNQYPSGLACFSCPTQCLTCTSIACLTCVSPCSTCTFAACSTCIDPVSYFTNGITCTSCQSPLVCSSSTIQGCSGAYYLNTSTNPYTCSPCGLNCNSCTSTACTACTDPINYYIIGAACTSCNSPLVCASSLRISCTPGSAYYFDSSTSACLSCGTNCALCTSSACTQCTDPTLYYINGVNCTSCSSPLVCSSSIISSCVAGTAFYYDSTTHNCIACQANCGLCSSASVCTQCTDQANYYINGPNCNSCNSPLSCSSSQIIGCISGLSYYFDNTTTPYSCVACGSNCQTCTSSVCSVCVNTTTYFIQGQICTSCASPLQCSSSEITGCDTLLPYYFDSSTTPKSCIHCQSNCALCTSSACTQCTNITTFYINGNNCSACILPLICTNSIISGCSPQYYLDTGVSPNQCISCGTNCQTCNSSGCNSCTDPSNYYIDGVNCDPCTSPLVCSFSEIIGCTANSPFYYNLVPPYCHACGTNCALCTSTVCTQCNDPNNQYLDGFNCTLCQQPYICSNNQVTGCSALYYLEISTTPYTCLPCGINCLSCISASCNECANPVLQYISGLQCQNCSSPLICSGSLIVGCNAILPYYYDNMATPTSCIACPPQCSSCDDMICMTCVSPCQTCDYTSCLTCIADNYYISGISCIQCQTGCASCNSTTCLTCPQSNQYPIGTTCSQCPSQCLTCNSSTCFTCVSPCGTCSLTTCLTCFQTNYYISGITCIQCPQNCATCDNTQCLSCISTQFQVNGNSCQYICNSPCQTCTQTECLTCLSQAYYVQGITCVPCQNHCLTCSSSTNCLTCDSTNFRTLKNNQCICMHKYQDIGADQCQKIDCTTLQARTIPSCQYIDCNDGVWEYGEQCDNGNISLKSGCTNCLISSGYFCQNTILQPSKCYLLPDNCLKAKVISNNPVCVICKTGFFLSTNQQCNACSNICNSCIDSNLNCLSCKFDIFRLPQCALCETLDGYYSNFQTNQCNTVCGDQITQGSEQCDDGNTLNGDGCSANCIVEQGYYCSGIYCWKIDYPVPKLTTTVPTQVQRYQNNRTFYITYDDILDPIPNITASIQISILSLSVTYDYNYSITNSSRGIQIDLNFTLSIENKSLDIQFNTAQFINQQGNVQQVYSQSIAIPDYIFISSQERDTTSSITLINQYILYFLFGIIGCSLLLGGLETFYNLLDLLQAMSYLQFINTNQPYNLTTFLNLFQFAQFTFISQYLDFQKTIGQYVDYSTIETPPKSIYEEGYLSFTLLNASSLLVVWISAVGVYGFSLIGLRIIDKINLSYTTKDSQFMIRIKTYLMLIITIIVGMFESICAQFVYSGIIRTHQSTAYSYCLMLALGFNALKFDSPDLLINLSSIMTLVLFVIYAGFTYFCFKLAGLNKSTLKSNEEKFGAIYEGIKLTGLKVYQNCFLFIKKFFFMICLVQMYFAPMYQAANVLLFSIIQILILVMIKPIGNFHENIKQIVCESLMAYTEFLLLILVVDDNFNYFGNDMRENVGYGCIVGLILIILTQVAVDIRQQWVVIMKYWTVIKKFAHNLTAKKQDMTSPQLEFIN